MIDDTVGDKVQKIINENPMFSEEQTRSSQKLLAYYLKIGINHITEITKVPVKPETILRWFR